MKYAPALTSETFLCVSHKQKKQKDASTSIKAILRSKRQDKKGVYIRVTIDREHDYYPTTYYVHSTEFDIRSGVVKGKDSNKEIINSHIRFLAKELDDVLTELKRSKDRVSVENLRKYYSKRYKKEQLFQDFFNEAMISKGRAIEPSTMEVYKRLPKKLAEFRGGICLRDIDRNFIKGWEQWLLHEKGVCQNTANHYMETLRTFLLKAIDEKLIDENPFSRIKISKIDGERDYLTEEELQAFSETFIPEENTGELRSRDLFLFCCLTGIRYSDLVALKWSHLRPMTKDMYFQMQKTKIWVTIPLIDKAMKLILSQNRDENEFIFRRISNQKLNEHLHSIEKRAKIQKNITVHVARHTFATLALERGIPLEVVSRILGHKSIKMTMIYAKITQKRLQMEMQKMNGIG